MFKLIFRTLVSNNDEDSLGFVKVENSICVALFRAKYGMYVFGNFEMLSRGSGMYMCKSILGL